MTVRRALMTAYMLGRSGHPPGQGMIDRLMHQVDDTDVLRLERELAALKREVAALRREVEASRPHKVIAMKRPRNE